MLPYVHVKSDLLPYVHVESDLLPYVHVGSYLWLSSSSYYQVWNVVILTAVIIRMSSYICHHMCCHWNHTYLRFTLNFASSHMAWERD